jgi:HAMP domain-containing protein
MGKIKNLSLRKTIVLYMIISLIISFYLSALIMRIASTVQNNIWWNYVDQEEYFEMAEGDGRRYLPDVPRPHSYEMKEFDYHVSEICDFLQTFTVLIVSVAGSIIAVFLFYKHKLKCPIEELELASRQVGRNNLDFHITYENEDEMGGLCKEFERMRGQLAENNSYGKCLRKKRLCGLPLHMIYVLRSLCWRGIRKCFQNIFRRKR